MYILVNSKHVLDRTKKLCLLIGVPSWELLGTADTSQEITIEINFCRALTTPPPTRRKRNNNAFFLLKAIFSTRYVFKYENHIWLYYWKPKVTIVSGLPLFIYSNVRFVCLMRMNNMEFLDSQYITPVSELI